MGGGERVVTWKEREREREGARKRERARETIRGLQVSGENTLV